MSDRYRDYAHLVRLALLFLAGIVVFLVVRAALVPKDFGALGHYRPGALDDNRERKPSFAGQAACAECHDDVLAAKSKGKHVTVHCEACHGALASHAADPTTAAASKPVVPALCLVCHLKNAAKPSKFPQVDPDDHAGTEPCNTCHAPHSPAVS